MKTPIESLQAILTAEEFERLAGAIAEAPASSFAGAWVDRVGAVVLATKSEGQVIGYLLTPAPDVDEAEALAREIATRLAPTIAAMRDAGVAARLLLKRISGSDDGKS